MIYLAVIGGGCFLGYQFSLDKENLLPEWQGREGMMIPLMGGCALLVLTIWRNIFISAGVVTRSVESPNSQAVQSGGSAGGKGGINWIGVALIIVGIGVARTCMEKATRKMQNERSQEKWRESLERTRIINERNRQLPITPRRDFQRQRGSD